MNVTIDLLDDVVDKDARQTFPSGWPSVDAEAHECDGCGETLPDVDLYAEDSETGDQVWLCVACGEW